MHLLVVTSAVGGGKEVLPALEFLDHRVSSAPLSAQAAAEARDADVLIIDATGDIRAAALACRTAAAGSRPVLVVVSGQGLAALKASWGLDDWVLADVSLAELETRLRLLGEHARGRGAAPSASIGDLSIDEATYIVRLRGVPLDLTYREFELLKHLAANPGWVFTREQLLQDVWGYDFFGGTRTVDVHIRRLRAKLGAEHQHLIGTVRGVGYKLDPHGLASTAPEDSPEEPVRGEE